MLAMLGLLCRKVVLIRRPREKMPPTISEHWDETGTEYLVLIELLFIPTP